MSDPTINSVDTPLYKPAVSTLEQLLNELPLTNFPALIGELERLKALAFSRFIFSRGTTTNRNDPDLLTIPEVAKRLNISSYRAYELARQGMLETVRLGRSVRVKPSAVAGYLSRQGA
jgi:excisionase family DNA binding protein